MCPLFGPTSSAARTVPMNRWCTTLDCLAREAGGRAPLHRGCATSGALCRTNRCRRRSRSAGYGRLRTPRYPSSFEHRQSPSARRSSARRHGAILGDTDSGARPRSFPRKATGVVHPCSELFSNCLATRHRVGGSLSGSDSQCAGYEAGRSSVSSSALCPIAQSPFVDKTQETAVTFDPSKAAQCPQTFHYRLARQAVP